MRAQREMLSPFVLLNAFFVSRSYSSHSSANPLPETNIDERSITVSRTAESAVFQAVQWRELAMEGHFLCPCGNDEWQESAVVAPFFPVIAHGEARWTLACKRGLMAHQVTHITLHRFLANKPCPISYVVS